MIAPHQHPRKGSLLLLVMCLLAVLGIALAGYLAVSNQSMRFSNRAYATDVSRHLAEMGLERAIRSFSFNTFSSWTLSGNTAKQTLTTSSSPHVPTTYGNSGITPSVNIRVDNYRTTTKAIVWSPLTTYAVNDYVWYRGVWYLCRSASTAGTAPSSANWTAAPAPWSASANYQPGNIVILGGNAYSCKTNAFNINRSPPNTTYWTAQSPAATTWSAATTYNVDDVAFFGGVAYRCISGNTNYTPPNSTYWVSAPVIYSEGVATLNDSAGTKIKTQLRAYVAPAPLFPNALGATAQVILSSTGTVDSYNSSLATWNSSQPYSAGDVVRISSTYYRCILAHTNQSPPNTIYWTTTTPLGYSAVIAGGNTASTAVSIVSAVVGGYVAGPPSTASPYASNVYSGFGPGATAPSLTNPDGSVTSAHLSAAKVDLTRISRSPYIPQFDIQSVTTGTNIPLPYSISGPSTTLIHGPVTLGAAGGPTVVYNITRTHDNYDNNNYPGLDLWYSDQDLIINGPVILNITGLFRISQGSITINNGGSLEIYFSGQLDIGYTAADAAAGITNNTNDPTKLLIVGTSTTNTVNNHYVRTKLPFCGLIYMPNAYLTMTNSGYTNQLFGAFSASNIRFTNTVNFRYDTALRTAGAVGTFIEGPYMITEWRELTDPTEKVTMP